MTPEQKAAYIIAQSAAALGQIFAMHAENAKFHFSGEESPHGREAYEEVINSHGINHNQVIEFFRD